MKKIAAVILVLLLVLLGVGVWFWKSLGASDAARLLPQGTVVLVSLPDTVRTAMRWPSTTLAKIGVEPDIRAFLEKPFARIGQGGGGDEAAKILVDLKPTRLFFAVTSVKETAAVVGFQFLGSRKSFESAVGRLRTELDRHATGQPAQTSAYNGVAITVTTHGPHSLFTAVAGRWAFLSNNLDALHQVLDRAAGTAKDGVLADLPRYQKVVAELPRDPDLLVFSQPQAILDTLLAFGQSMGAQQIPAQVEQARKVEAIGIGVKLEGADIRDAIFVLRPDPPDFGKLSHAGMKLTSPDTFAYFDFLANFAEMSQATTNPFLAPLLQNPAMQGSRLVELAPQALGPECSVSANWPAGQMKPEVLLAVQVRDAAKAAECLRELTGLFPETVVSDQNGVSFYSFPSMQSAFANPTVAQVDGFLIAGLDPAGLERVVAAGQKGPTLDKSPAFGPAQDFYAHGNEVFGFVNTAEVFTRAYDALKPIMTFGIALVPGMNDYFDSTKLPPTQSIARHLQPMISAQTRRADGYLLESRGPITMNQAALLSAAVGFYFASPTAAQQ